MMSMENVTILVGSASERFGRELRECLGARQIDVRFKVYSNGNIEPSIPETVRGKSVYIVQSGARANVIEDQEGGDDDSLKSSRARGLVNGDFMELCLLVEAARDSAQTVRVISPYWFYSRSDKKDKPRIPIGSSMCMRILRSLGVDRLITGELHSMQQQGFGSGLPVDQLFSMGRFIDYFLGLDLDPKDLVIVAPDLKATKACGMFADRYRAAYRAKKGIDSELINIVAIDKRRPDDRELPIIHKIIGQENLDGRIAIFLDDEILSGNSLLEGLQALANAGMDGCFAAETHGIFSRLAVARFQESGFKRIVVTNSIDFDADFPGSIIDQISIADLFAEAIRRIERGSSVSELCE